MTRIGFVGLGNMGAPMCHRLIQAGHQVHVFDADPDKTAAAALAGGYVAESAADCARAGELFFTSLPRPDHVRAVMVDAGALAALPAGAVWVDLTTNQIDLVTSLADRAPDGVAVVDSPVTGAVDGARNGRLTLFAGGDPVAVDRVRPVLDVLGTVISCGPLGTGNVVKLVTNQLWFIGAAASARASRSECATASTFRCCGCRPPSGRLLTRRVPPRRGRSRAARGRLR